MIAVTGAAGHVGNVLVRTLLGRRQDEIRAVIHRGGNRASLAGLDVECVEIELADTSSLVEALSDVHLVFHTAGMVSISTRGLPALWKVNVEGTRNLLVACRAAGVRRFVYTSSVHAFVEPPPGGCLDETNPVDPARSYGPYAKTKAQATLLVQGASGQELETVVVCPSGIIGPYDFRPSHTGQFILDYVHRRLMAYVEGGYDFVDVRDVAEGTIAAAEHGRAGEAYILSGHAIRLPALLRKLEALTGVRPPSLRFPVTVARGVGMLAPAYYRLRRQQPLFTTYSIHTIRSNYCIDSGKARSELVFSPRPLAETLADTVGWFKQQGLL